MRTAAAFALVGALLACGGSSPPTSPPSEPSTPPAPPTGSVDLCSGLVQDQVERAVPPLERPPRLAPITDPAFGTRLVRITDVSPAEGEGAVIKPMYSTTQAWNADESLLILWHRGRGHELYDGRTYAFRRTLPLESPTDIEQVYWDPVDPDVLYYPSSYQARPRLLRFRVSLGTNDLVREFTGAPTSCPVAWDALLSTGNDPQDMSWGAERIIGLNCGDTSFLYSIAEDRVLGVMRGDLRGRAPAPSYDGMLAYHRGRVLNQSLEVQRRLDVVNPGEHSSLGRGASGPLYAAVDFDGSPPGTLVVHDMRTGEKRPVISTANGWPYPPSGTHVSGLARTGPLGWFAVSVVGQPPATCLPCGELLLANADSGTVCRVAHHRSFAGWGRWGYWAEPHVVLSPSGTRLLFGSDWGDGTTVNTYVVELPAYSGRSSAR